MTNEASNASNYPASASASNTVAMNATAQLLLKDGFITEGSYAKIMSLAESNGHSFIKTALNFGFVSRKNYERSLTEAGYKIDKPRHQAHSRDVLNRIDLMFATNHLALPLRIENNRVVTLMADPADELFIDFIKFTYDLEPEIIVADDLDITWMSHKLLGEKYVKSAVYDLMNRDPDSSAVKTFTTGQLAFIFILLALTLGGMVINFRTTSIIVNVLMSVFFLISISFKLFLALVGSRFELYQAVTKDNLRHVRDDQVPVYTIHLPV